ncbi:hypothetical protein GCM10007884_22220 [Methylobacterium brachythecii]|uniref:Ketopantoate reductase C-terminal domain-containing protein n=1 Tax=Methylobacterium brachythecii TaxID=1176177 RepID=A0ABQ6D1M0_9HYPH|nr:hypothetical protein GCM10007884_22220 [Methylobacterium brachythecii]
MVAELETAKPQKWSDYHYSAGDLKEMVERRLIMQAAGIRSQVVSIDLYVEALRALARERKR